MNKLKFIVNADHVSTKYTLVNFEMEVHFSEYERVGEQYAATSGLHGYGKSRATPEEAITDMLISHGNRNIRISPMPKLEGGVLTMRKPRGKKLTFMMGCGGVPVGTSGVEYIRRDLPRGEAVYVWCDDATGEQRHFSIVPVRS
jgi:hypothetical protein